jgi:hypothetical protein
MRRERLPELLLVDVLERGPDDAALGEQTRPREVEDPRQQFALRKASRRPEEHHHVGR